MSRCVIFKQQKLQGPKLLSSDSKCFKRVESQSFGQTTEKQKTSNTLFSPLRCSIFNPTILDFFDLRTLFVSKFNTTVIFSQELID